MSLERARGYLAQFGIEDRIMEFSVSSATVELAAQAVGCEPARIAKTLSFKVGDKSILIVVAGDARINNAKFKARFNTKAKMLTPDEVEQNIGHAVGGVCPFGINAGVDVYLDISMKRFDTVFPACGSANSAICMSMADLEQYAGYTDWVDVCSGWK